MASLVEGASESQRPVLEGMDFPSETPPESKCSNLADIFQVTLDQNDPSSETAQQQCFEAVLQACKGKDWEKIEACKDELTFLTDKTGRSILHHAACSGDRELFAELFQRNIARESSDKEGNTALDIVAKNEDILLLGHLWDQIDFEDVRNWAEVSSKAKELYEHSVLLMARPIFQTLSEKDQAKFYSKTGATKNMQGQYKEALKKFEQALKLQKKSLGPNHPDIANTLNCMGNCLLSQDKTKKALEKHEEALAIYRKSLGPNHPDIANTLNCMGDCLLSQDKTKEALEKHEEALAIYRKSLDPNHPDIFARSLHNIGNCLYFRGKEQEAMEKHEQALAFRRKSLDTDHPDIAASLNIIGLCLSLQGQYKEALEKFEQALVIRRKSLDPNHLDIAESLSNIGRCLHSQGKTKEALEKYEQALAIYRKSLKANHPDIARSLNNIGHCLYSLGEYQKAAENFHKAFQIATQG